MSHSAARKELLQRINVVSFASLDAQLFLDTHPCDEKALAYFQECSQQRRLALKEYAAFHGPLTADTAIDSATDYWNWINEPWPWQEGGC